MENDIRRNHYHGDGSLLFFISKKLPTIKKNIFEKHVYFLFIGYEKIDGQKKVESRPSVVRLDRLRREAEKKVPIFFYHKLREQSEKVKLLTRKKKERNIFRIFQGQLPPSRK